MSVRTDTSNLSRNVQFIDNSAIIHSKLGTL